MPGSANTPAGLFVDDEKLFDLAERDSLKLYIKRIWKRRHFIIAESKNKAFSSYDHLLLGKAWLFLEPIARIAMYGVFFGLVLNTSRGIDNFLGFLIIGVIFFGFMSKGLTSGSRLIQSSRNLIAAFSFPKASLPISTALRSFYGGILPSVVAIVSALAFQHGKGIFWGLVLVIPLYILLHIFALGLTFMVARVTAFIPDAQQLLRMVGRGWFYISGVFFSVSRFDTHPQIGAMMEANPAYRFLEALRSVILYQNVPPLSDWVYLIASAAGSLILGFLFFWRAEQRYLHVR